jgi:hypothetical protein
VDRALCEQCGERQPADAVAGALCVACGAAVRREVRCAWCAEWVPAGRFCRACGCEVVEPDQYGAARILKSAGVDRFSLVQRLRELDPERVLDLARIYNGQLAVVSRRVEEVRLCEEYLLQRGFSRRLEEELIPQLPMEKEALASLGSGPAGPFNERPELLPDIAQRSPLSTSRTLACLALLRRGSFEGAFGPACQALASADTELALEAALTFAHWRVRLLERGLWKTISRYAWLSGSDEGIEARQLAEVASTAPPRSALRPWAAAAVALAWRGIYSTGPEPDEGAGLDWVRPELRAGLSSSDADLRFTCALALGDCQIVSRGLESRDLQQRIVSRRFLARHNSPALAPLLIEGPEEIRAEILDGLSAPLPDALIEPVLTAVEKGGEEVRSDGVRLLLPSLTERIVERLVRLGQRKRCADVFKILLGAEQLPVSQKVVRELIAAGLFETLYDSLCDSPQHVDFADESILRFSAKSRPAVLEQLVKIADRQLDRRPRGRPPAGVAPGDGTPRFLARVAFGSGPAEIRCNAYEVLDRYDQRLWTWLTPAGIRQLFGGGAGFLNAAATVLEQAELAPMCGGLLEELSNRWLEVAKELAEDRAVLMRFVDGLRRLAAGNTQRDARCRSEAVRLLTTVAVDRPEAALPGVTAMLREAVCRWEFRDVPASLLAEYDKLSRRIRRDDALAADLADALVVVLTAGSIDSRHIPALELLTRLARDHAEVRQEIANRTASILKDREYGDRMLRSPLEELAAAVGFGDGPEAVDEAVTEEAPAASAEWDDLVILPDEPLKTLAEYVAFLKAMSKAPDPMAVMTAYGMTQDSFRSCIERWGEVICSNNEIALRYSRLVADL